MPPNLGLEKMGQEDALDVLRGRRRT